MSPAADPHRADPAIAAPAPHVPVLLDDVLRVLQPRTGALYVDGTFGAGGYSKAILAAADCGVYAVARDPAAIARGRDLAQRYPGRLELLEGRFGDLARLLTARGVAVVHGIVFDLGTSSPQLDEPARGFSFRADGPLDMRMSAAGASAADLANTLPQAQLPHIIWRYGEERQARRIPRATARARPAAPIARTTQLSAVARQAGRRSPDGLQP